MSSFNRVVRPHVSAGRARPVVGTPASVRLPPPPPAFPLPTYATPAKTDLAVVIPFFNPTQALRPIQNILLTTTLLKRANIPFFIAELATGDAPFLFPESPTIYQYRSSSYMFYKENLFVAVEQRVPVEFTKLLLLDSDLLFGSADWYDRVSVALDDKQVIQSFSIAYWLKVNFVPEGRKHSVFAPGSHIVHTGFGWAFRRAWFREARIFEMAVIGGGDSVFYTRLIGKELRGHPSYKADFETFGRISPPSTGCADLSIYHLFHGSLSSRQYATREDVLWTFLQSKGLTRASQLLVRRDDGILEWRPEHRDACNALLLTYFQQRRDDSV
jgi:hypothetical protein